MRTDSIVVEPPGLYFGARLLEREEQMLVQAFGVGRPLSSLLAAVHHDVRFGEFWRTGRFETVDRMTQFGQRTKPLAR